MNLALTLVLLAAPPADKPAELPKLAVMDLELKRGLDKATAEMLNELMLDRLSRSKRFDTVIGGSDLREMLSLEEQKVALGCEADSCLAELGGALGVPLMMSSSLGTFAGNYILNLKLISVEDAKVLARSSRVVKDETKLLDELTASLDQIVSEGMNAPAAKTDAPQATPKTAAKAAPAVKQGSKLWAKISGVTLLVGGVVTGTVFNNPGDVTLEQSMNDYKTGGSSWAEFSADVERRNVFNGLGVGLSITGAILAAYGWLGGS